MALINQLIEALKPLATHRPAVKNDIAELQKRRQIEDSPELYAIVLAFIMRNIARNKDILKDPKGKLLCELAHKCNNHIILTPSPDKEPRPNRKK